ncbi:MAG: hypothetical protein KIG50_00505 [Lachnospiraceae bacterium]|nr:hypothetical protein [Lachnospiraceae bacterium]
MRKYNVQKQLTEVKCNVCGRNMKLEQGMVKEGCFIADYSWGYFSSRDGMRHQFDVCEECYDNLVKGFSIPVTETENAELI